jgi:hypothetical protein
MSPISSLVCWKTARVPSRKKCSKLVPCDSGGTFSGPDFVRDLRNYGDSQRLSEQCAEFLCKADCVAERVGFEAAAFYDRGPDAPGPSGAMQILLTC